MKTGAKTKGWIKNNTTGVKKPFLFNPATFSYSRSVNYAEFTSPGLPYPAVQYVNGNSRKFDVTLYIHDVPSTGKHNEYVLFFGAFLTPETNVTGYTKPPEMTFCMGDFIRRCVLEELKIEIFRWDKDLNPIESSFTLTLRQVGV